MSINQTPIRHCRLFILLAMLLTLFIGASLVGTEAIAKTWRLKIQAFTVPGKYDCQWIVPEKFTELIEKYTDGKVKCSLLPAGELVGATEVWTAVSSGTVDGGTTLDIYQGGTHPEFSFDVGAIWTIDEFFQVMHSGALELMNEQSLPENVRIIGYFPLMNYYAVSMKHEHVRSLEDLKGKKVRGMGGAANVFLRKVGAGIVTLPMSEVPTALQTGVVDGIHTGMAGLYAMNLWDVAPYFTATHSGNFGCFIMLNEGIYQEFPDEIKQGIGKAQKEMEEWYKQWDKDFWENIQNDVEKKGVYWYDLPKEESRRWKKLLTDASVQWVMKKRPNLGAKFFEIIEDVTDREIEGIH